MTEAEFVESCRLFAKSIVDQWSTTFERVDDGFNVGDSAQRAKDALIGLQKKIMGPTLSGEPSWVDRRPRSKGTEDAYKRWYREGEIYSQGIKDIGNVGREYSIESVGELFALAVVGDPDATPDEIIDEWKDKLTPGGFTYTWLFVIVILAIAIAKVRG